jgi:metacaspase-1
MKRALIIGINYFGSDCELNGCINDAINIKNLLITKFNYHENNIIVLDDHPSTNDNLNPTKANILKYFNQLISLTKNNDTLFFSWSGHGSQIDDKNGDEMLNNDTKGKDDVLCPCDYENNGFIIDDELRLCLEKLPSKAKFRAIVDACHSGSMFDLPFIVKNNEFIKIEKVLNCDCLSISGCRDSQTSCDAYIDNRYTGALTHILIKILNNVDKVYTTWGALLSATQHFMINEEYTQMPMVCVSFKHLLDIKIDL